MREAAGRPARLVGTTAPLAAVHDVALLDLDGVVYIGPEVVPGAAEALDAVRADGMVLRFVTNNASRPPQAVADHLTRLGVPATVDEVVTSAQVAAALLAKRFGPGAQVLVVGGDGLREALRAEQLVPVEKVGHGTVAVVQGFGPDVGWRHLAEAAHAARSGRFWMATNLDLTVPTPSGPAPGNGSLVAAVSNAVGHGPDEVAGKPQPGAFREAAEKAGAHTPLVVGDRLDTDLEGARAARMPGLLVLTGVTGVTELLAAPPDLRPDHIGLDLWSLGDRHPAVEPEQGAAAVITVRCGRAVVTATPDRGRAALRVEAAGLKALDLLRAGAVATWAARDADASLVADTAALIEALRAAEPGMTWAR
jgi:glycerol-1-phosphatase